jgi:glyoxylase-like metal-dependent hydrolase (beta-lactamase superfamily II)
VIVEADYVFAITGDALPIEDNYREWVPPGINIDPELAIRSMERIVKIADYVIPGHDKSFKID